MSDMFSISVELTPASALRSSCVSVMAVPLCTWTQPIRCHEGLGDMAEEARVVVQTFE